MPGLCVILTRWRVRARPAPDSDPVRRQGPERGSTGGGGRPPARLSSSEIRRSPSKIRRASHAMMISDGFVREGELFLADTGEAGIGQGLIYLDSTHG